VFYKQPRVLVALFKLEKAMNKTMNKAMNKTMNKAMNKTMNKAYLTMYRFMYPQHFDYLMAQGMGIRWNPDWAVSFSSIKASYKGGKS